MDAVHGVSIGNAHEAALGAFPEKVPQLRSTGNPLKSQKQQKLVQNRAPKKNQFWIHFGAHSGPRMAPKMGSKLITKFIFFGFRFGSLFLRSWSSLGASWEPSWACGVSLGRPLDPKNMKKHMFF